MPLSGTTEKEFNERSFLDCLPKDKVAEILNGIKTMVVPAGTVIFRQGDPGDNFYIIKSGKLKAFRSTEEGLVIDVGVLGPGNVFGELSLLTGNTRSGTIETLEETVLKVLPKEQFDRILKDYPLVTICFLNDITKILHREWEKLEEESKIRYQPPRITWFDFFLIFGVTIICALIFNFVNPQGLSLIPKSWSEEPIAAITPTEASLWYKKGEILFIDARPSGFYIQKHIKGALSLPSELFDIAYLMELDRIKQAQVIVVYGRTISSLYNEQVAGKLRLRGHQNVSILAGDLSAWETKGYPTAP